MPHSHATLAATWPIRACHLAVPGSVESWIGTSLASCSSNPCEPWHPPKRTCTLAWALTHSLTLSSAWHAHSITHSPARSLTHSLSHMHSLTRPHMHSHPLACTLTQSTCTHSPMHPCARSYILHTLYCTGAQRADAHATSHTLKDFQGALNNLAHSHSSKNPLAHSRKHC